MPELRGHILPATLPDPSLPPAPLQTPAIPVAPSDRTEALSRIRDLHEEAANHFCEVSTRLVEIWTDEVSGQSASAPELQESCHRLQLSDELGRLVRFCESHMAREEQALRDAGMRRFGRAWVEHKRSHARFVRRLARRLQQPGSGAPGYTARKLAAMLEDYWSSHYLDHDQLALSLLSLLDHEGRRADRL